MYLLQSVEHVQLKMSILNTIFTGRISRIKRALFFFLVNDAKVLRTQQLLLQMRVEPARQKRRTSRSGKRSPEGNLDNTLMRSFIPVLHGYRVSPWFAWCINEHVQGFGRCPGVRAFVFLRQVALDGTISRAFTACCGRAAGSQSLCLFGGGSGWEAKQEFKRQGNWFSYAC